MRFTIARGAVLVASLGAVAATGAGYARFPFQPESKLWVEGSSTVRGFTCRATALDGAVEPAAGAVSLAIADLQSAVRGARVTVPVGRLDCGNGTMNDHMRKALRSEQNPTIQFRLSEHRVTPGSGTEGAAKLTGQLQIAGQERPVSIDATLLQEENGTLRVRGSKEILMTEFGVKPPSLMMGTMKVKDRVVVHFDVALKP